MSIQKDKEITVQMLNASHLINKINLVKRGEHQGVSHIEFIVDDFSLILDRIVEAIDNGKLNFYRIKLASLNLNCAMILELNKIVKAHPLDDDGVPMRIKDIADEMDSFIAGICNIDPDITGYDFSHITGQ